MTEDKTDKKTEDTEATMNPEGIKTFAQLISDTIGMSIATVDFLVNQSLTDSKMPPDMKKMIIDKVIEWDTKVALDEDKLP